MPASVSISRVGGIPLVEAREDGRFLGVATGLGLDGEVEEDCADGPAERETEGGTEEPSSGRVESRRGGTTISVRRIARPA